MSQHTPVSSLILLGRIMGVYGVRGWVKIYSECRPRERIFEYRRWFIGDHTGHRMVMLSEGRQQGKGLVAKLSGVDDRDSAYALNGKSIYVSREELPELDGDEYYWADLIGSQVRNTSGDVLGVVVALFETGANDVMVIEHSSIGEILIPFVQGTYIMTIDLEHRHIVVDWPLEWLDTP